MTKTEWKKLYHDLRHDRWDFENYMQSRNFPCGYDDMMYERHEAVVQDFLDANPILKKVLSIMDSDDELAYRVWLYEGLDPDIKQQRLIERMAWQRDDRRTA